jgi:hypothetical protein
MTRIFGALLALTTCNLAGCATGLNAFFSRPTNVDEIEVEQSGTRPAATVALDATRRVAIFNRNSVAGPDKVVVCSEPPPDAVMNVLAQTAAQLKIKGPESGTAGEAQLNDQLQQIAVSLATRSELIDGYRTFSFMLCQLHANGGIAAADATKIFADVSYQVFAKAGSTISAQSGKSSTTFIGPTSHEPPIEPTPGK